ncbi:hypothetical protein Hanom_Chr15g01400281 [Helianthus anomalus]
MCLIGSGARFRVSKQPLIIYNKVCTCRYLYQIFRIDMSSRLTELTRFDRVDRVDSV